MTTLSSIDGRRLVIIIAIAAAAMLTVGAPARAQELGDRCTSPESGYTLEFPIGWYVNGHVDGGGSDDVAACRYFSPDPFEVQPASQVSGIAVAMSVQQGPPEPGEPITVGGRPAVRVDSVSEADGFDPAGTRYHSYWIDLTGGTWLLASTSDAPTWIGAFDENRRVLDEMMESLTFGGVSMPDTAIDAGVATAVVPITLTATFLVVLAVAAFRLASSRSVT
jgi:hypothetical protein